jgi:DNA helicase-2/ATP-dependent DNA helicase PcrA
MQGDLFAPARKESPQQAAVVESFRSGEGDLAVTACAGSGKTFTIIAGIAARPEHTRAVVCAFSKDNAKDLEVKLGKRDKRARACTLHSIGNRAVMQAFGHQVPNKHREREAAARIGGIDPDSQAAHDIGRLAQMAKEIAPDEAIDERRLIEIAVDFGLAGEEADGHPLGLAGRAAIAREVVASAAQVHGEISFSDMLYLPLALGLRPDQSDFVVVDEAQDMNLAHHRLARAARARGGRLVVVGDPRQAIYSWRGAAPGALEHFARELRARHFKLSVTFRCARAIVAEARKIVPDIEAAPGAIDGLVRTTELGELARGAQPGDFVLSRTNAPLIRTCLTMRRRGARAVVSGGDLEADLIRTVRTVARSLTSTPAFLIELRRWRDREIARATKAGRRARVDQLADQADTLTDLAGGALTVSNVIDNIRDLFLDDGRPSVVCSTVHRAKGREADRVWILQDTLDAMRPSNPAEELEEANIKYVAYTRARRELVLTTP